MTTKSKTTSEEPIFFVELDDGSKMPIYGFLDDEEEEEE